MTQQPWRVMMKYRSMIAGAVIAIGLLIGSGVGTLTARSSAANTVGNCSPGFPTCWFSASCSGICRGWECHTTICNDGLAPQEYCYKCEGET